MHTENYQEGIAVIVGREEGGKVVMKKVSYR